jgi:hypothetical protein
MTRRQKHPLRDLSAEERQKLERIARATSEAASRVARAKALLAVSQGYSYGDRPRCRRKKNLIEQAYRTAEAHCDAVWCQDEAGPFQTVPYAAPSWQPEDRPQRQSHE